MSIGKKKYSSQEAWSIIFGRKLYENEMNSAKIEKIRFTLNMYDNIIFGTEEQFVDRLLYDVAYLEREGKPDPSFAAASSINFEDDTSSELEASEEFDRDFWINCYRVQDNDSEKKRAEFNKGNVNFSSLPLNISIGYPDHAVYFLQDDYTLDIITFKVKSGFIFDIINDSVPQKQAKGDKKKTTINDPTKPGIKLEIKSDKWREELNKNTEQGTAVSMRGIEFVEMHRDSTFSPESVISFANTIYKITPETKNKIEKAFKNSGVVFNKSKNTFELSSEEDFDPTTVRWDEVKAKLWVIYNQHFGT